MSRSVPAATSAESASVAIQMTPWSQRRPAHVSATHATMAVTVPTAGTSRAPCVARWGSA